METRDRLRLIEQLRERFAPMSGGSSLSMAIGAIVEEVVNATLDSMEVACMLSYTFVDGYNTGWNEHAENMAEQEQ